MNIIKKIDVGVQPARSSGREAHEKYARKVRTKCFLHLTPRVPRGMLTLILFLLILFLTRAKDFVKKQGLLVVYPNLGIEKKIDIMFYVMERC